MSAFLPSLRQGVAFDGAALDEPLLGRRLDLSSSAAAVVRLLDGTRDLDALARDAAVAPAEVERVVRALMLLNLLDGAGDPIVARLAAVASGHVRLDPLVLDEARFACQGSGDCCRNFALGPLRSDDVERLAALPLADHFPVDERGWFVEREVAGRPRFYLRNDGSGCVFLQRDGRCGIHARFGAEAKPLMCRLFPFEQVATIAGRKVYDKGACSTFAISARAGRPLVDELPRLLASLPPDDDLYHPVVLVDGEPCDYGHFLPLQAAMCALVARRLGGASSTLLACARLARAFADALAACPLAPGEPDATVARACAVEPSTFYAPPAEDAVRDGLRAALPLLDELAQAAVATVAEPDFAQHAHLVTVRRASELDHALRALRASCAARLDGGPAPALASIAIGDEHDEIFRVSFRQQLFGRRALVEERLGAGLLRLATTYLVARWAARLHAAADGCDRVAVPHLNAGHTLAVRVFSASALSLFSTRDAAAWTILPAIAALD